MLEKLNELAEQSSVRTKKQLGGLICECWERQAKKRELFVECGDKWRCDACGKLDWMIIEYSIGKFRTKACYDCYTNLEEATHFQDHLSRNELLPGEAEELESKIRREIL